MRLEWLEDILAVLETGSFNRAAEQRLLTQPAFSRRIRAIERYVGVDLFDRSRKPVQLRQGVRSQQQKMQELAAGLRDLLYELRRLDREAHNHIVIASQHAIAATIAPDLVRRLSAKDDVSVRLRSANRDECLAFLVSKQADLALMYRSASDPLPADDTYLEQAEITNERLTPVVAANAFAQFEDGLDHGEISVVGYPTDVSLGLVLSQEIFPSIQGVDFVRKRAETALTLAALQLALSGVGIAWVPHTLAAPEIEKGALINLSERLPASTLTVVAARLAGPKTAVEEDVWQLAASASERTAG